MQAFVVGVAPRASTDIGDLMGSEGLVSSSAVRGGIDPDEGPRGEGQGTLLQVCHAFQHTILSWKQPYYNSSVHVFLKGWPLIIVFI